MHQPTIVFAGHVCIDHNNFEGNTYQKWGSPALFMTKYFQSAFQLQPHIIASYGADFLPYAEGIQLYPKEPNLAESLIYENIVKQGHRTQYCHNAASALPVTIDTAAEAILSTASILFVAPLTPAYGAAHIAAITQQLPAHCLKVLLPQGYLRNITSQDLVEPREFAEAADVLPHFDLVVLSDEDHPHAVARAHEWKQLSPKTQIIVTRNASGADIITDDGEQHIATIPVAEADIVDSVGCGDVFTAGTAYALSQGVSLTDAIQAGHDAARQKLLSPR